MSFEKFEALEMSNLSKKKLGGDILQSQKCDLESLGLLKFTALMAIVRWDDDQAKQLIHLWGNGVT